MANSSYISPFANKFPEISEIQGVKLFTAHSGMRYKKDDLLFAELAQGTQVGGIFTKNTMCGEPINWCKSIISGGNARALVVNSGMANVFCGEAGVQTIKKTVTAIAKKIGCNEAEVFVGSTGIIGQPVNDDLLIAALETKLKPASYEQACVAINTTDTFSKGIYKETTIAGKPVKIAGIIKGSGMIAPNMATMLGYIFTDAAINGAVLQELLSNLKDETYNAITVDSDTSTSDMILAFATGKAGNELITDANSADFAEFKKAFFEVNLELAKLVVKDGEGITKFITIEIEGAANDASAHKMALSVANSPLVKTAIAGGDANWGRIVMAIGKSDEPVNIAKTKVVLGDVECAFNGTLSPSYNEQKASEYMKGAEIKIYANVGVGTGKAKVYTCDLTHEYISINADYRS
jgi:glutamate N-acetyltransferase/amino-acid N-acetyltransferase